MLYWRVYRPHLFPRIDTDMGKTAPLSFSKSRRLTTTSEFQRVKREGSLERGKLMMLGILPVSGNSPFRAGFVTSRTVGGAVVRSRVRRWLREIVRRHQKDVRDGFWIVLIARSNSARASYATLEDEWLRLARRASILTA